MRLALAAFCVAIVAGCVDGRVQATPPPELRPATNVLRDTLVRSAVKAALIADDPDSTTTVGVAVNDGVVTLTGTVRDAGTRGRFVADAGKTGGVKRVVDALRVDPNAPRLKQQVSDVALAARVEAAITAQLGIEPVSVRVRHGVAELGGTVHDAKTKATIVATARGTSGIRNVVDEIRVAPP